MESYIEAPQLPVSDFLNDGRAVEKLPQVPVGRYCATYRPESPIIWQIISCGIKDKLPGDLLEWLDRLILLNIVKDKPGQGTDGDSGVGSFHGSYKTLHLIKDMPMKTLMPTVALCAFLAACGADDKEPNDPALNYTPYQSNLARDLTPDVDSTQFEQLVEDNNQFALDLFHQLRAGAQDIVASPLSVSTTLAMTYAGAGGATKEQMAQALQFNQNDAPLHAGFNRLTSAMDERNLPASDTLDAVEVQIVNAIWPALSATPAQPFLDTLAVNYGEGVYALDYQNEPETARQTINTTVEKWTAGLITELLPDGAIDRLTEVVLTNTIYLKAPWNSPFQEQQTQLDEFTNLDGSISSVETMTGQASVYHAVDDSAEVLILPFRGGELEMAFIMPNADGYNDYLEQAVDMATITAQLDAAQQTSAMVRLPRFEQEFEASLVEPMKNLGMVDAFGDAADFIAMGLSEDLRLTAIRHKAIIEVDEGGVVAAAATAAVGGATSIPMPVAVDRPFIYLIRDRPTGAILFFGTITHLE